MAILIASGNLGQTVLDFRKRVKGISRCRLTGTTKDGVQVRIVPYHLVDRWLNKRWDDVVWHGCVPNDDQLAAAGKACGVDDTQ